MSVKFWLKITAIAEKNVTEIIGVTSLSYPVQSLLAICRKGNWRVHVENHAVYISNTISTLCVALAKAGAVVQAVVKTMGQVNRRGRFSTPKFPRP